MTTQYTTILKLALPVQGELSGTWGDVVNDNITQMVEQAVAGKAVVNTWTGNSHTLTTADGTTSESRCAILELTDSGTALTGAGTVVCPTNTKLYIVDNNTAQIITVKTSGGTGVAVPVGKTMLVYCDGTNVVEGVTHANSLSLGTSTVTADKILDEDNMASDSATAIATQQSIKAYVDSQVGTVDTLSEILANGNTTGANDIDVDSAQKVQFRDAAIYLNSSVDGQLDIVADGEVQIDTALVDINGNLDVSGTTNISGSVSFTKNAIAGVAISTTSRSSNTVTVTTSAVHGLTSGDLVNVNGVADTSFNGYFTASVSSTTVFTYSQTGADGSSTGGTSTEVVYNLNASGTALNWMNGPLNIAANSGIDGLEITQSGAGNGLHVTGTTGLVGNVDVTGRFTTTGNVGIGTSSPSEKLTIQSGNLNFMGGTNDAQYIKFGDTDDDDIGNILYYHGNNNMVFTTNASEAMRINSAGNLILTAGGSIVAGGVNDLILNAGESGTPDIYLQSGGSTKVKIEGSNGNVGIGTSSPGMLLDLDASSGSANDIARFSGRNSAGLTFRNATANEFILHTATSDALVFGTNGNNERMRIDASGDVGIGTDSPSAKLHIENGDMRIEKDTKATIGFRGHTAGSTALAFRDANAAVDRMTIDSSGNVGIGTDSPSALLHLKATGGSVIQQFETTGGTVARTWKNFVSSGTGAYHIQDATASANRVVIDTSGNVGIGNSSPSGVSGDGNNLVIGSASGDNGLSIISGTSNSGSIYFGDTQETGSQSRRGQLVYNHSDDSMRLFTASTERLRIDHQGNILANQSSTSSPGFSNTTTGLCFSDSGRVFSSASGAASSFNRNSSDGNILEFRKDGATVGSIGTANSGDLYIGNDDTTLLFAGGSDAIIPRGTAGATRDAAIDLGLSAHRFKDLYLSATANVGVGRFTAQSLAHSAATLVLGHEGSSKSQIRAYGINAGTIGSLEFMVSASDGTGNNTMTMASSGNVGIGEDTPAQKIHLRTSGVNTGARLQVAGGSGRAYDILSTTDGSLTITDANASAERMRIDASGNVGIGVTPENSSGTWRNLQFGGGNLASRASGDAGSFIGTNYVFKTDNSEVYKNTAATSRVYFNSNTMQFQQAASGTAGTSITWNPSMTLDASGNLLVGTTSLAVSGSTGSVTGAVINSSGLFEAAKAGTVMDLNRLSTDGTMLNFRKDGTTVGRISVYDSDPTGGGGELLIASGNTGLKFDDQVNYIRPSNGTGALRDNIIDLGKSDSRFKNLYLSSGVVFGDAGGSGTPSSNTLDSYEQGTCTMSIGAATTDPTIDTGNDFTGYYTKVGDIVTVQAYTGSKNFTNVGSGNPRFTGLPFNSKSGVYSVVTFVHNTFFTSSSGGYIESGSSYFYPIIDNTTQVAPFAGTGTRYLMMSVTYQAA